MTTNKNLPMEFPPAAKQLALNGRKLGFSARSIALDIKGAVKDGALYPVEQIEEEVRRIWKATPEVSRKRF